MSTATLAQIAANQANAQNSPGPRTEAGRAVSSRNALKTGITGRTVLLPGDDADQYAYLINGLTNEHRPVGDEESRLVQSIADTTWRLWRIPALEAGVYAVSRIQLKDCFPAEADPAVRAQLIEAKIYLDYHRQLNNLSIQESRLRRQEEKDRKRLSELQELRRQRARLEKKAADARLLPAQPARSGHTGPSPESEIGFEFSNSAVAPSEADPELESAVLAAASRLRKILNAA